MKVGRTMNGGHLWKDEYKIGDKTIDSQHYQLFYKIERIVYIAKKGDVERQKKECEDIIEFLISYTMTHFKTEEALQKRMGYVDYERHKKIHEEFKITVQAYKERLQKDFSEKNLKNFIGTLLTWLVVHVCVCDKKIVHNEPMGSEIMYENERDVLEAVAKKFLTDINNIMIYSTKPCMYKGYVDGKIIVESKIQGDKKYVFLLGFSEQLVKVLYHKISNMQIENVNQLDEMEKSALQEIAEIIATYAIGAISKGKMNTFQYCSEVFGTNEYESRQDISNSVILDITTECGVLEILFFTE